MFVCVLLLFFYCLFGFVVSVCWISISLFIIVWSILFVDFILLKGIRDLFYVLVFEPPPPPPPPQRY